MPAMHLHHSIAPLARVKDTKLDTTSLNHDEVDSHCELGSTLYQANFHFFRHFTIVSSLETSLSSISASFIAPGIVFGYSTVLCLIISENGTRGLLNLQRTLLQCLDG